MFLSATDPVSYLCFIWLGRDVCCFCLCEVDLISDQMPVVFGAKTCVFPPRNQMVVAEFGSIEKAINRQQALMSSVMESL